MKEYTILGGGSTDGVRAIFSREKLQTEVNEHTAQGWTVTAVVPGQGLPFFVMEKPVEKQVDLELMDAIVGAS